MPRSDYRWPSLVLGGFGRLHALMLRLQCALTRPQHAPFLHNGVENAWQVQILTDWAMGEPRRSSLSASQRWFASWSARTACSLQRISSCQDWPTKTHAGYTVRRTDSSREIP